MDKQTLDECSIGETPVGKIFSNALLRNSIQKLRIIVPGITSS